MPRPRKDDTRKHQLNIRFTPRELARVHHHAGLLGKTAADQSFEIFNKFIIRYIILLSILC